MRTTFFKPILPLTIAWNVLASAVLWCPAQSSAQTDVTQPTDPIVLVNGVNDGDGNSGPPPGGEVVGHVIDNVGQKYLNFLDLGSGFAVQPQVGPTVVAGLRFYTANDAVARDPASYLLEGSALGLAGPWTAIASGALALPAGRNSGGNVPLGVNSQTVTFVNSTAYAAYRVTFPTLKDAAAANSMQISEVELLGPTLNNFIQLGRVRTGSIQYNGPSTSGESYTITGGGNDTWDRADEMAFAYHELAGDFDIQVQVTEIQASGTWSKAGIMVRESLAEDARRVAQTVSPCGPTAAGNGACSREFLWRTGAFRVAGENGGNNSLSVGNPAYPNAWIRLVREGTTFSGYAGSDGVTWDLMGSIDTSTFPDGALPAKLFVGLSVSRHPSAGLDRCKAEFTNYKESSPTFCVGGADSKGCPDKVFVCFTRPVGTGAYVAANYAIGGVTVNGAGPGPDDHVVVLTTGTALAEGSEYFVSASSVFDAAGNALDGNCGTATFLHGKGYELRNIHIQHNQIDGAGLAFYEDSVAYRLGLGGNAAERPGHESNTLFEDPAVDSGTHEVFSGRMVGVLAPSADGDYRFAGSSDDEGKLFLSTDDQPAHKVLIAREPIWNGSRNYGTTDRRNNQENQSAPIALTGGRKYYLEYIYAEGGGGNNGSATWDAGTGTPFANGDSPIEESNFIPSRFAWGHIFYNFGAPVIVTQPASLTVPVGGTVNFDATLDGTPPYQFQWRRDGSPIPGANGRSLNFAAADADNNAKFSVSVFNACGKVVSQDALLTVLLNPRITSCTSRGNCHAVYVSYNKPMNLDGTYTVTCRNIETQETTTLAVTGITVGRTDNEVCLSVTPDLIPDINEYCVTVTGAHGKDGLPVDPATTCCFKHGAEYPVFRILSKDYDGIGGVNTANLYSSPKYPKSPDVVRTDRTFFEAPADTHDNYGGVVSGVWIVPEDGTYRFYCSADDGSDTFMATDANPANKVLICREPIWNGGRQFAVPDRRTAGAPENRSEPFDLVAGQRIYLEGVFKEGGGGDNYSLAVTINTEEPPANGSDPIPVDQFQESRIAPDGTVFTKLCDVFCNPGPSDQTVPVGDTATFTATPDGTPPYAMQWKKNGVAIPGATSAAYTTPPVTEADDGATYTFSFSNDFSSKECGAVLRVKDCIKVAHCGTWGDPAHVYVFYNQPVNLGGTYIIDQGVAVTGQAYGTDNSIVVLNANIPADTGPFSLTITGVTGKNGEPMCSTPLTCTFSQGPGRACFDFEDGVIPDGTIPSGTVPPFVGADPNGVVPGMFVHLTDRANGQVNYWSIPLAAVQTFTSFKAVWKTYLEGVGGADGISFNVGQNLGTGFTPEEGAGNGLSVCIDTYNNGANDAGVEIKYNGARLGFIQVGGGGDGSGAPAELMKAAFVDTSVDVSASGVVTFKYDNYVVTGQIPNYSGITANQYLFAGRTGGANENAWIDDLCINDFTLGPVDVSLSGCPAAAIPECSSVTLSASASGSPDYSYQWSRNGQAIAGATGSTYTTPSLRCPADQGAVYKVTVKNHFSEASATCTIQIDCDTTPPTIVSVGSLTGCTVGVCFSEAVDPTTATDPANYSVNGGAPGAGIVPPIRLRADGKAVELAVWPCLDGNFTVTTKGVLDNACGMPGRNSTTSTGSGTGAGQGAAASLTGVDVGTPGNPAPAGSVFSCENGVIEISAGGSDVWDGGDHAHFLYEAKCGDFDVQVKVESVEVANTWSKGGLMARVSLDTCSAMIAHYHDAEGPGGANQVETALRTSACGITDLNPNRAVASDNPYLRLQRIGDQLIASHSADGQSWTVDADTAGTLAGGIPPQLLVGLFVTSHNNGTAAKGVFRDFQLRGAPCVCGPLDVRKDAGNVVIRWLSAGCRLQGTPALNGAATVWTDIPGGSPVTLPASGPMRIFRLINP